MEKAVNNNYMKKHILPFLRLVLFAGCFINCTVMAQTATNALGKKIVVTGKQITIDSLLGIFSRQTAVEFSFNSTKISPAKKITVPKQSLTVFQWLQILKQEVNIDYKLIGNHLVLLDRSGKGIPVNSKPAFAVTNAVKKDKPVMPGNKIFNSKVQNNYSAPGDGKILPPPGKDPVAEKEQVKNADTLVTIPARPIQDTGSGKNNLSPGKLITGDSNQVQLLKSRDDKASPVTSSSVPGTDPLLDYKHQLTLTPGIPIWELSKYYKFSIGLDYDRKLFSFGRTVNRNNTAWNRFNVNLELGADYVFHKDSTGRQGLLVAHLFPDIIYKLGQYGQIDLGGGLAGLIPSPGAHLGFGINLSVNLPVARLASHKVILFGVGIEMYEFGPYDALYLGTLRLTMLFPGKKR